MRRTIFPVLAFGRAGNGLVTTPSPVQLSAPGHRADKKRPEQCPYLLQLHYRDTFVLGQNSAREISRSGAPSDEPAASFHFGILGGCDGSSRAAPEVQTSSSDARCSTANDDPSSTMSCKLRSSKRSSRAARLPPLGWEYTCDFKAAFATSVASGWSVSAAGLKGRAAIRLEIGPRIRRAQPDDLERLPINVATRDYSQFQSATSI